AKPPPAMNAEAMAAAAVFLANLIISFSCLPRRRVGRRYPWLQAETNQARLNPGLTFQKGERARAAGQKTPRAFTNRVLAPSQ
ncbi:hypothetical protein, partial [Martelella sp. AD-3]|uniref:hypothetical protein n=1 Tax=Martelella sp. AD-3 TaxID=686597 RepID=UPI001AEBC796